MQPPRRSPTASLLAVELDGIQGKNGGVLLVVCTNFVEAIDDALLRPGRIGIRVRFHAPDREGKATLLAHYLADRPTAGPIDCDALARLFDPRQPAAAVEEAVARAWRRAVARSLGCGEEPALRQDDLCEALLHRILGPPPTCARADAETLLRTAVHEVGHALVAIASGFTVNLVTIRAGGDSAGLTMTDLEDSAYGLEAAQARLRIAYGGMVAERLAGFDNSLGNESDTASATRLAVALVDRNGIGMRAKRFDPMALAGPPMRMRLPSDALLARLDEDALDLLEGAYASTEQVLAEIGGEAILELARILVEREKVRFAGRSPAGFAAGATGEVRPVAAKDEELGEGTGRQGPWREDHDGARAARQQGDPHALDVEGDPRGGVQSEEYRHADPRDLVTEGGVAMAGPAGAPQEGLSVEERRAESERWRAERAKDTLRPDDPA